MSHVSVLQNKEVMCMGSSCGSVLCAYKTRFEAIIVRILCSPNEA